MSSSPSATVGLDRSGEPWVGTFPGLGSVRVWADGRVEADPERDVEADPEGAVEAGGGEPGPDGGPGHDGDRADHGEPAELRRAALVHGWGEPLALARLGFRLAHGTAMVAPGADRCLLVSGDPHDAAIVVLGLAARGWQVLADRLTPVTIDVLTGAGGAPAAGSGIIAHPRPGPVLTSAWRASRAGIEGTPVRADTDAVVVAVARADTPHPVTAVVTARIRRPHDPLLDELRGHRRVEVANGLLAGGALAPSTDVHQGASASMARTMRLAALPMAAVHVDPAEPDLSVDALLDWWAAQ